MRASPALRRAAQEVRYHGSVHSNKGKIRIIAGEYRGRRIAVPDRPGLRPTPDRVRETLFNWLGQSLDGLACLDLFAGSGALGFEAASRGAARVVMVEQDRAAFDALEKTRAGDRRARRSSSSATTRSRTLQRTHASASTWFSSIRPSGRMRCRRYSRQLRLRRGARVYVESGEPLRGGESRGASSSARAPGR